LQHSLLKWHFMLSTPGVQQLPSSQPSHTPPSTQGAYASALQCPVGLTGPVHHVALTAQHPQHTTHTHTHTHQQHHHQLCSPSLAAAAPAACMPVDGWCVLLPLHLITHALHLLQHLLQHTAQPPVTPQPALLFISNTCNSSTIIMHHSGDSAPHDTCTAPPAQHPQHACSSPWCSHTDLLTEHQHLQCHHLVMLLHTQRYPVMHVITDECSSP
jgi:hypothetical protein